MSKREISFISKDNKKVSLEIKIKDTNSDKAKLDWESLEPISVKRFSICGEVCGCSGQVMDEFQPTKAQARLVDYWKEYHLNDCCSGTKKQEEALADCVWPNGSYDYDYACKHLENKGLLVDRGFEYGTGFLAKSFPENELNEIIAAIEEEEADRTRDFECIDLDSPEAVSYIEEYSDLDTDHVIVILKHLGMSVSEIDNIECVSDNHYNVYGSEYYVGTDEELEDIAREYLDREQWVAAVDGGFTDESFSDWVESVIDSDGFSSILNSYDGTSYTEEVDGEWLNICRAN